MLTLNQYIICNFIDYIIFLINFLTVLFFLINVLLLIYIYIYIKLSILCHLCDSSSLREREREMEGDKGKVCVTGGTGFLASWLIMRLLEHGYSVHTTIRPDPGELLFLFSLSTQLR